MVEETGLVQPGEELGTQEKTDNKYQERVIVNTEPVSSQRYAVGKQGTMVINCYRQLQAIQGKKILPYE